MKRLGRWLAIGTVFAAAVLRFIAEVLGWVVIYGWFVLRRPGR